jgi:guanine nucleotide exchange factor VAV
MPSESTEQLWYQCGLWLQSLKAFPPGTADAATRSLRDLTLALRDGVVICAAAAVIDPAAVDMRRVSTGASTKATQFLCLKNINVFLDACEKCFGLNRQELFEVSASIEIF